MKFLSFFLALLPALAFGGRPVFHPVTLTELIAKSSFVFVGWPSPQKPAEDCARKTGAWHVHKVLMGDKSLEGKIIPIAVHRYQMHHEKPMPSYAADKYKDEFSFAARSTILFTNKNPDGCFELTAQGAQEGERKRLLVESIIDFKDCDVQLRVFGALVEPLPKSCSADSDCKLFYLHPNSCEAPKVLSKSAEAELDQEWIQHMARIRNACRSRWEMQPACEPQVFPVRCKEKICEAGLPPSAAPKFTKGTLTEGCAPHDGAATILQVKTGSGEFPQFSVNWWASSRPKQSAGTYTLADKEFSGSYCPYYRGCDPMKDLQLKVKMDTPRRGTGEFKFRTYGGEEFRGTVPLEFREEKRTPCG